MHLNQTILFPSIEHYFLNHSQATYLGTNYLSSQKLIYLCCSFATFFDFVPSEQMILFMFLICFVPNNLFPRNITFFLIIPCQHFCICSYGTNHLRFQNRYILSVPFLFFLFRSFGIMTYVYVYDIFCSK